MSADSIAKWNAIPMERPSEDWSALASSSTLKRTRDGQENDSDDDISIASRTPSPPPSSHAMDIDKYDEYVRGVEREVITVDTRIKPNNKGFAMLAKLGWVEGQPLGLSQDGRVDPVPFYVKNDLTGLGKTNQDVRMIESTVSQRRELDSEKQTKETEEQRRAREDAVARKAAVKDEISTTLKAFYCELCDKQFKNVAQYDEHTNSYAHHHKARFRDMQLAQRAAINNQEELDKRKEKERKREEKELRKIAKAAGIKMAKPIAPVVASPMSVDPPSDSKKGETKKSGWATLSSAPVAGITSSQPSHQSGWAPASTPANTSSSSSSGWAAVTAPPNVNAPPPTTTPVRHDYGPAPSFRNAGWTSLDTGSTPLSFPSASSSSINQQPSIPISPPSACSWSTVSANQSSQVGYEPMSISTDVRPPPATSFQSQGGWSTIPINSQGPPNTAWAPMPNASPSTSQPASFQGPSQSLAPQEPQIATRPTKKKSEAVAARQETSRSGWQQFRSGASSGRRK
ncbi:hypothetical protein ABKN59_000979 [Abortiporus biennis]